MFWPGGGRRRAAEGRSRNDPEASRIEGGPSGEADVADFVASPEALERARRAHDELAMRGEEIRFESKWWGFKLVCNQAAIDTIGSLRGLIADVVGAFLPSGLAQAISLVVTAHLWIKSVSKGRGCTLVSPWISPTMLIPVATGAPAEDTSLWFTVFESGSGWGEDEM
ncbi:hypothetical protein EDD29_4008 [Actinocorallia herbida]|uniref:Uncharacterized protein n=1 Tax=Actinocorallia herbida TaxID=58109 RepID=A0A3N1D074_9ACTN|nr:hypothetical protein EDD29_4008 [Actinocorallia herbida]